MYTRSHKVLNLLSQGRFGLSELKEKYVPKGSKVKPPIDKVLEKGLKSLCWSDDKKDKEEFIEEAMGLVTEAYVTLTAMKDNMKGIEAVLKKWAENPLITRKQGLKTYTPGVYAEEQAKELELR